MIKYPNLTSKQIFRIKEKRNAGMTCERLSEHYNISRYYIVKILRIFKDCNSKEDVEELINHIEEDNEHCKIKDNSTNYARYRDYYMGYNRGRATAKKANNIKSIS